MGWRNFLLVAALGFMSASAWGEDHSPGAVGGEGIGGIRYGASGLYQQACGLGSSVAQSTAVVDPNSQPGIFDELYFGSQVSGAAEFFRRLRAAAERSGKTIHLGFGEGVGLFTRADGLSLNSIFVSSRGCASQCNLCDAMTATSGPCHLGGGIPQGGTSLSSEVGICGEIATAHGLVHNRTVMNTWAGVQDGSDWDSDFITRIWREGGSTVNGTTKSELTRAHGAEWNQRYYSRCGTSHRAETGLTAWCERLAESAASSACNLFLYKGGPKKDSGHHMFVKSAVVSEGKCRITTVDTGNQGSPLGVGIPLDPGAQTWEISPRSEPTEGEKPYVIENTEGANGAFWNQMAFHEADFFCCGRQERMYFLSPNPNEPGTAFQ